MPTELTPTAEQQAVLTAQLTGESICITAVAGCLAGDTLIHVNRAGKGFIHPIERIARSLAGNDFFTRTLNGKQVTQRTPGWDPIIPTRVARAEGQIVKLGLLAQAWYSGEKVTYTLTTVTGRSIRATAEHPFLTADGLWAKLGALKVGDSVQVNTGRSARPLMQKRQYRYRTTAHHPHQVANQRSRCDYKVLESRLVVEAGMNGLDLDQFIYILRNDPATAATLVYLNPDLHVHHVDEDVRNNTLGNLQVMTNADHQRHHNRQEHVLWQVGTEQIASIEKFGIEATYDIQMADEPHNFIANGFVVHNSGKTSTLRMIAQQIRDHGKRRPDGQPKKVLYVAYNKKAQLEAEASFGNLAECRTVHSLAYQWLRDQPFGRSFIAKLNGQRRTSSQDAYELGIHGDHLGLDPAEIAGLATATVGRFQNSDSQTIEPWMVPTVEGLDDGDMEQLRDVIVGYARDVWRNYMDPRGKLKPQHDTYVKMWARKKPILGWDVILYDEAQDADPCAAGVMELNAAIVGKQVIAVGDSSQAIYGWRGAVDFLDTFKTTHRLSLTQSWRFGQTVADEANVWLGVIGAPDSVVGNPGRSSSLEELDDATADAVLCRTNAGTIENLISAHEAGRKVHLVGDGKEMLSFARAAEKLQKGQRVRHPDLMAFRSWDQVLEYVEKDKGGADLKLFVRMVEQYGCQGVISAIDQALPEKEYMERRKRGERVLVVSTAHKSKGLEWDKVRIGGDFKLPTDKETGKPRPIPRTDAMLAYVAITRCRVSLDAGPLGGIHAHLAGLAQAVTP